MSRIKMLLWDIDGTILDFPAAEKAAIRSCFDAFALGKCTDEMLLEYSGINRHYWHLLEQGKLSKPEILVRRFEEFLGNCGLNTSVAEAFNAEYQLRLGDTLVFHKNAMETLIALKGNYVQCAATNGTKVAQERKLASSGLDQIFDYVFISEDIGFEKPAKGFFDAVFKKTRMLPGDAMMIGDSLTSDIKGGLDYGILTCWYNSGGSEVLSELKADHVIHDLDEIPALLDKIRISNR